MRIICPTCVSHYEIDPVGMAAAGQLVRCAQCRDVWLVHPPAEGVMPRIHAEDVRPMATSPAAAAKGPEPVRAPIDFYAARARLRPAHDISKAGNSIRGTLGAVALVAVGLASVVAAMGFRTEIVRHAPAVKLAFAAVGLPVNPHGLALRGVHSALEVEGGKTVLTLQGEITNLRDEATKIPPLDLVVRGAEKAPLYSWSAAPPKTRLAKGETVSFHSRLAAPPKDSQDVRVSFAEAEVTP